MDEKKNPRVYLQELPSQTSFATSRPIISRHESSAPPDLWSSEPQILKDTKLSKWINYAYDTALCIAPILLMVKIGLTILASTPELRSVDRGLTRFLTNFNDQVCSS
jgi:hypothetical protein